MNLFRGKLSGKLVGVASLPTLFLYLLSLSLGVAVIGLTRLGQEMKDSVSIQHLGVLFVSFRLPVAIDSLTSTLFALGIYFACFAVAFRSKGSATPLENHGMVSRVPNWLVVMPILSSTLLAFVLVLSSAQESFGLPIGAPPSAPLPILFAGLATAPISEELNFRITSLGLIVAASTLLFATQERQTERRRTLLLLSFWNPDAAKARAGMRTVALDGARGINPLEWAMLLASSVIFGLSHIGPSSGWGPGKVTTAALSGFVIGLCFLVYGAYAAILLHWFFDYYLQFFSLLITGLFADRSLLADVFSTLNAVTYYWSIVLAVIGVIGLIMFVTKRERAKASALAL